MIAPLGKTALSALTPGSPVALDPSRCVRHRCGANACTACIDICPVDAISWKETGLAINHGACTQCLQCLAVCPTEALLSPELSLLQIFAALAQHPLPVLGCGGQPDTDAHARLPCLGYLAHPELMCLCALVFGDGLQINLTHCDACPNGHIRQGIERAHKLMRELVPNHRIALVTRNDELDFQSPALSRRQLFSMFRKRTARAAAAAMVGRLQTDSDPRPYGSKMVPALRMLLLKALQSSSGKQRAAIAGRLFGHIAFTASCTGSERCVGVCPTGAIQSREDGETPPVFKSHLCVGCGSCQSFCRDQGVSVLEPDRPG